MAGTTLGAAYVQIVPSMEGTTSKIAAGLNSGAAEAGTSFGGKLGEFAKKALASAAIGKVVVDAFKQGAALEQSIGGVETLFGKSADKLRNYASQAWQSAGISANTYMEQSTSFAASLLQGLGGDTAKAADYANRAIISMADNSNKYGTDLSSLQMAFQGFAKQNYTMLDNLKLGYGGTKTEMQRLIQDASTYTDIQKEMGITVDSSSMSFDNIVNAIAVMQEKMGVAGTTSEEAATTMTGSFMAMKAAAQDFMGNLVLGENLGPSMANLANSACTFLFDNLVPAIGRVIQGIPSVAISLLQTVVPSILDRITQLINAFADGDGLSSGAKKAIGKFAQGLIKALPDVIAAVGRLVAAIIEAILKLPGKMVDAGISAVKGFIKGLKSIKLPKLHITWSTETKGKGKNAISIPKPTIEWYAKGGIFDNPSVIGVGEAGAEAVVPLDKLWTSIEQMGEVIASTLAVHSASTGSQTIEINTHLGGAKVAEEIFKLNKQGQLALQG